jgi:hypothetical protein
VLLLLLTTDGASRRPRGPIFREPSARPSGKPVRHRLQRQAALICHKAASHRVGAERLPVARRSDARDDPAHALGGVAAAVTPVHHGCPPLTSGEMDPRFMGPKRSWTQGRGFWERRAEGRAKRRPQKGRSGARDGGHPRRRPAGTGHTVLLTQAVRQTSPVPSEIPDPRRRGARAASVVVEIGPPGR